MHIVTTTVNNPTDATIKFCQLSHQNGWHFLIVGDLKTPHEKYLNLTKKYKNIFYLTPDSQKKLYPAISKLIGWNTIQRRNIGFIHAIKNDAEIIATIDDDNIPYDKWGQNLVVGKTI